MRNRAPAPPDRAVSEILSYILIFSLVTLAATSVFLIGTGQLEEVRNTEQINNAERAFDVLAGNLDEHITQDARTRSTEIRMADASLSLGEEETFTVTIDGDESIRIEGNPLVYESAQGSTVVYSFGAVFREEADGGYLVRDSGIRVSDDRVILPVVATQGAERLSSTGTRVVQIRTQAAGSGFVYEVADAGSTVTVDIDIQTTEHRAAAWASYFDAEHDEQCDTDGSGSVFCEDVETAAVYLPFVETTTTLS